MTRPVVGIGELLWDVFPDGRRVAGGAPFNFAFHCRQLGHAGTVVSRVGDDALGRELRDEVRRLGLTDEFIQTDPERPTGTVQVTLDAAGVPAYRITEGVAWDAIAWDEPTARLMYDAAAVCFGSLVQREVTSRETVYRLLANVYGFVGEGRPLDLFPWAEADHAAGAAGPRKLVVFDVNLRQHYYDRETLRRGLREANWCKLNDEELALLVGLFDLDGATDSAALDALRRLDHAGKDTICLTRGASGATVRRVWWEEMPDDCTDVRREVECDEPAPPADVIDTVGAGDAFTAAMVCLHLEGRPLRDCLRFALHYAARVCEHRGATPRIDRAEVERAALGTP
ncbi:carbohydrate kinase family protein [Urbifossiella limnaea]|uniref:Aminoimidazole riboside kinase n=1 Tax=Urbifossiella limnaea TaxID=2528023 RepID=A0A517Y0D6_9BACT|nr:carbohydrate kinase [Urbifossiella limnaea]QDU23224.1 aminoimidazole riboside kinase [Urbifossiella limnaea]